MSDLLTGTDPAPEAAQPKSADGAVSTTGGASTDSIPAYFAGLTKAQKEKIAKAGVKLPSQMTDFGDHYLDVLSKANTNGTRPAKDAPKEQWDAWRKSNGIPETADGYVFDKPQLPEGEAYSDEAETWWKAKAYELGLSPDDAKKVYGEFIGQQVAARQKQRAQSAEVTAQAETARKTFVAANKEALEVKYGPKFPEVVKKANEVFTSIPTAERKMIQDAGLANSAWFISMLYDYGRAAMPDSLLGGIAAAQPADRATGEREINYGTKFRRMAESRQ